MRRSPKLQHLLAASLVAAASLYAGAAESQPAFPSAGAEFTDPFAYCAAVITVDEPDARYAGKPLPPELRRALAAAGVAGADQPLEAGINLFWRCMDGKLYACNVGTNIPCMARADTSREPSEGMREYCRAHAGQDMPAYATGRETVYAWRCDESGTPAPVRQIHTPDARGFLSEFWAEVPPAAAR
jgi:hypothetical protein